jgi:hypothetical protein
MTTRASLLIAAAIAACAFAVAPAGAQQGKLGRTVLVGGNAADRAEYQAMIDAAAPFARQADTQVLFRESNCPGEGKELAACVISSPRIDQPLRFYIPRQLRDGKHYDPVDLKNTILHELGHVYDFLYSADGHRGAYMKIFNVHGRFYSDSTSRPPYEKFAVGYSYCAENLTAQQARKRKKFDFYDYRFTAAQYAAFCAVLKP